MPTEQKSLVVTAMHIKKKGIVSETTPIATTTQRTSHWLEEVLIENKTRNLTAVCLPYVKDLAEKIQKLWSPYDIRKIFRNGTTLRKYLFQVKPSTEFNMIKNYVYTLLCSCNKVFKSETCRPLKIRVEEHRKAVCQGVIEKETICTNGMKLRYRKKSKRIRFLKEAAHMLSRPRREMNTIWEPLITKARYIYIYYKMS